MQLGMIGLGRMGANMVRRLLVGGTCLRRIRCLIESGRGDGSGGGGWCLLPGRSGEKTQGAARYLADGPGGDCGQKHRRSFRQDGP